MCLFYGIAHSATAACNAPQPFNPNENNDPCAAKNAIAADQRLKERLDALLRHIKDTKEHGYLRRPDSTEYVWVGSNKGIPFTASGKYTEFAHTHPNGTPRFSAGDIQTLFKLFDGGYIDDAASFRFGLVVSSGYYFLHITDPEAFRNFATVYNLKETKEPLKKAIKQSMSAIASPNVLLSSFIYFLQTKNAGLTVIMGTFYPNSPSITWEVKTADDKTTLSNKDCH